MVMCVWTSISPGNPVYFDRSIISARGGITAASVVTVRMRSPSTITMAFVHSLPLASQSLPKRTALSVLAALAFGFSCAQITPTHSEATTVANNALIAFITHLPLHPRIPMRDDVSLLIQL